VHASISSEYATFPLPTYKPKNYNTKNYNFTYCFTTTQIVGGQWSTQENIWTYKWGSNRNMEKITQWEFL